MCFICPIMPSMQSDHHIINIILGTIVLLIFHPPENLNATFMLSLTKSKRCNTFQCPVYKCLDIHIKFIYFFNQYITSHPMGVKSRTYPSFRIYGRRKGHFEQEAKFSILPLVQYCFAYNNNKPQFKNFRSAMDPQQNNQIGHMYLLQIHSY